MCSSRRRSQLFTCEPGLRAGSCSVDTGKSRLTARGALYEQAAVTLCAQCVCVLFVFYFPLYSSSLPLDENCLRIADRWLSHCLSSGFIDLPFIPSRRAIFVAISAGAEALIFTM